ncbi:MAG TPA: HAD-IC family P-type ATPase [Euzebyales bacterium]|nr:HAD-IC family P-type ATPase [Euzebyales bacterium]
MTADSAIRAHRTEAWHALTGDDVARRLDTTRQGLEDGEVAQRLAAHGPNRLEEEPPPSPIVLLLHQLTSPLVAILLVAAAVTFALGDHIDAAVISLVILLNTAIGFFQERRAEQSVRALAQLVSPHAIVVRRGMPRDLDSADVVPGDVVQLEAGQRVPADARLFSATALTVDESMLTGESVPAPKEVGSAPEATPLADRHGMAYAGTVVATGRARGWVVTTGNDTELGTIAGHVREEALPKTPMQQRVERLARLIAIVVVAGASLAFAIGVTVGQTPGEMFTFAVAMAVSAIPEGLPVVLTITLAVGVRRMAARNAIIRRLPAVETLGSTTVIGSDKTGTLTQNRMTVQEIWTADGSVPLTADTSPAVEPGTPVELTLLAGALGGTASVSDDAAGTQAVGDPTEVALLEAVTACGLDPRAMRREHGLVAEVPFDPQRRYSAVVAGGAQPGLFVKGAPERVAEMCSSMLTSDGLVPFRAGEVAAAAERMARTGLRVLAMAWTAEVPDELASRPPTGLAFLGLQGMLDPPRPGVRDAIAACRGAGLRVLMITGDHAATAVAIARRLGLVGDRARPVSGTDLDGVDDEALRDMVTDRQVFARVSPEHKLRIVQALQGNGDIVAVTGDGVNDAPALKASDIGVAMGRDGTDVAREAADMVLADDNFVSIQAAVEEGRITFDNVRKVTFFLLSTGAAEILMLLTALIVGWPLVLVPAQLLWLNLVTNGLQDVALAFEPGEQGVLQRRPRARAEGVMSPLLWERTVLIAAAMAVGTLSVFHWQLSTGAELETARTAALTTMVMFQAFHVGNARSETISAFRLSPLRNMFLLLSQTAALGIHAAALYLPFMQTVLRVQPVSRSVWMTAMAVGSTIIVVGEIHKLLRRPRAAAR